MWRFAAIRGVLLAMGCLWGVSGCGGEKSNGDSGVNHNTGFWEFGEPGGGTPTLSVEAEPPPPAGDDPAVEPEPNEAFTPVDAGDTQPASTTPSESEEERASGSDSEGGQAGESANGEAGQEEIEQEEGLPEYCLEGPNKTSMKKMKVYYGTSVPQYLPMTEGQMMAVGTFWGCSGLLITPTWVLSASHCGLWASDQFCIGSDPKNPNICIPGKTVVDHPFGDIALFELEYSALSVVPGVEPVPILLEDLDAAWVGKTGEAAGYGSQEDGGYGEREFTAEPIVYIGGDYMVIDGGGEQGVCFGDSGGPLMVIDGDGIVRVAGALSGGDDWCTGEDIFTRVDYYRDWIESYTGPTVAPGPQACGDVDAVGFCDPDGTRATFCGADGMLEVQVCPDEYTCSWYAAVNGWRCIEEALDPCSGTTNWGACNGNVLIWCDEGGLQMRNCGGCEETCVPNDDWGYICVPSTCGDLLFTGECNGSVASWCNRDGEPESVDCEDYWQSCGWVDEGSGYYCK